MVLKKYQGLVLVGLVAILGYLLFIKTFWFHDDWVFLANAAGIEPRGGGLVRWVSYQGYWKLLWPIFGLQTIGWGVSRLLLHGASSILVCLIGRKVGLSNAAQIFSGLIFATAPAVFESMYWGTGAVELLGGFFSLLAFWLWLSGRNLQYLALLAAILAIFSKESSFFLPVFFAFTQGKSKSWVSLKTLGILMVVTAAVVAVIALKNDISSLSEYGLSLKSIPRNMLALGFWLVAPAPFQTGMESTQTWPLVVGGLVWFAWIFLAFKEAKSARWEIPIALALSVISMGPAALLSSHILPRYDYLPMAGLAITAGALLGPRTGWVTGKSSILFAAGFLALVWGSNYYRLNATFANGRPVHRLVVKEQISRRICEGFEKLPLNPEDRLVFFIESQSNSEELKYLQESLGESLGPRLVLGPEVVVKWTREISSKDIGAFVISVDGLDLEPMGRYKPRS